MNQAAELFRGLRIIAPAEDVKMSGAWASKTIRRYASPKQSGSGEGPYDTVIDWQWRGVIEAESPIVGIAVLSVGDSFYWVKSQPPTSRAAVGFSAHGWAADPSTVSFGASFHGAFLPSAAVQIREEPPAACILGRSQATTGTPHVVARIEGVEFAVLLLSASTIKAGRNRLWHLRDNQTLQLPPRLQRLMTRGRSGKESLVESL